MGILTPRRATGRKPLARRPGFTLALVVLLGLAANPARADRRVVKDGNDAHGRLDARYALAGHRAGTGDERLIRHRIATFKAWPVRLLADGGTEIDFLFRTNGDSHDDAQITVDFRRGRLVARMRNLNSGKSLGRVHVWRPNRRSVSVAFPKKGLGGSYRWYAVTSFHHDGSERCGTVSDVSVRCPDRVPNRGYVAHSVRRPQRQR